MTVQCFFLLLFFVNEISLMEFWLKLICMCGRAKVPAHTVRIKISITLMINIINGSINLANGSEPFIAGVETPIFKATEHCFFLEIKKKKKEEAVDGWYCGLTETDIELNISGSCCW